MKRFCLIAITTGICVTNVFASDHHNGRLNHFPFYSLPNDTTQHKDTAKKDSTDEDVKYREYEISLEGGNDQTNHGLRNKYPVPYMEPEFTYTAKSGFYISVDDQYLLHTKAIPQNRAGFDVFSLNPGWDFDLTDNTTFNVNLTYNNYKKRTPDLIKSNLAWVPETYIDQYIVGELEGKFTIDYDVYKSPGPGQPQTPNDIIFTPDLLYTFEWDFGKHKKNSFSVIPETNLEFGSRNFYTQYLNNQVSDTAKNGSKAKYYSSSTNSSFGTLDYNIILSIELVLGRFTFEPAITYMHPLYNQSKVPSTPYAYGNITISYKIKSLK